MDINVQRALIAKIRAEFPRDLILAEESGFDTIPSLAHDRCWIIDPIDGNQNFLRGLYPEFGVSIGLMEKGIMKVGGVLFPVSGDVFIGESGSGSLYA